MPVDEFKEFVENDYELLEDDEWDKYSLLNGRLFKDFFLVRILLLFRAFIKCLFYQEKLSSLPRDWILLLKK